MSYFKIGRKTLLRLIGAGTLMCIPYTQAQVLTLDEAINRALQTDAWMKASAFNESSQRSLGDAAGRLPDPRFNMALANMPTDTLDFNQEAMTQLVFGVSQMFPRGDTLALNATRFEQQADMQPLLRAERRARVRMQVSQLWLDAWRAQKSLALIEDNRVLFDQLVDVATSSYVAALGRTRQQDLIRAQLELTQLDERISRLRQQRDMATSRLSEWFMAADSASDTLVLPDSVMLPDAAVEIPITGGGEVRENRATAFVAHPTIQLIDRQIELSHTDVELARQRYKPEWGLSASYGYRGEDAMGNDRADLMTVGVTLDMPIFSTDKQDSQVAAARSKVEAVRTERLLKLREMVAAYDNARVAYQSAEDRIALYRDHLLAQSHEAAEAALNAYTSDDGNFAEVVRARINELNNRLALIELTAEQQKQITQINYLLTRIDSEAQ
ncbi:TolC family protein [Marinobacterium lacunae]|nr:TolC family protein [Marinobacterium lacunae]